MTELIDRHALLKDVYNNPPEKARMTHGEWYRKCIYEAPTIEPEVRHGRWIPVTNGRGGHECDQCRNYAPSYQTGEEHLSDYCPNCGAKMDQVD